MLEKQKMNCRMCGSGDLILKKGSGQSKELTSSDFAITDSSYGLTLDIFSCNACGLIQCPVFGNVLEYYVALEDAEYEATRKERSLQAIKTLNIIKKYKPSGALFDVGAGSGILVKQAIAMGYQSEGIEPSEWLYRKAQEKQLPVSKGVISVEKINKKYDIITIIDVIEHVENPNELLAQARCLLQDDGLIVITTPDVDSFCAKLFGWKWWHYRVAHITYFNKRTLTKIIVKAGFEIIAAKRPSWYFTLFYLFERLKIYMPKFLRFPTPQWLKKVTIPLNLFDSWLIICKPKI